MSKTDIDPKILEQVKKLEQKYEVMGQNISSYLDGLLYADYLTYWDYIHLDTLLSLQNPKTPLKDEMIFIIYHQITELYFKLILWEIEQLIETAGPEDFLMRLKRVITYFKHLTHSFEIMSGGMEKKQFLKFRMSLLPASGFQSGQYRLIEIYATDFINLVAVDMRPKMKADEEIETLYKHIYWKKGATELATGKKTLTLSQFEKKYSDKFIKTAKAHQQTNIWQIYQKVFQEASQKEKAIALLKEFDLFANVYWPLAHLKSAAHYLEKDPEDIAATGGTNWQKYLPPRFQKIIFYPELWSDEEQAEWGKQYIQDIFKK